jgi:PhzF family phenazine biosynthesis protein
MRMFQVDAFTEIPFTGNPAGVCLMDGDRTDRWMQDVAAEMNLSETAFVTPREVDSEFGLRWFTPATEVNLCGHATLASAHVLWEESVRGIGKRILFHTKSGILEASKSTDWVELAFPARIVEPAEPYPDLFAALGIGPVSTWKYSTTNGNVYLLEVQSEEALVKLQPDFQLLSATDARATIVTSRAGAEGYDFASRFFAPAVGIDEDPVTGSAHCYLAPFWAGRMGKADLTGFQASERTGLVRCRASQDRVYLSGRAVTVFRGDLLV